MSYDPFARGAFPVGVATASLRDPRRGGRTVLTEFWYPAVDAHAGQDEESETRDRFEVVPGFPPSEQAAVRDAVPRLGGFPCVIFSHGWGSHRRQSTFLCTHLASHGYVVAAPEHEGNTVTDLIQALMGGRKSDVTPGEYLDRVMEFRPRDVEHVVGEILAGRPDPIAQSVKRGRFGLAGHSFGGWTALATAAHVEQVSVLFTMACAGGPGGRAGDRLLDALELDWDRVVPALFLAGDSDSVVNWASTEKLYRTVRAPAKLVTLKDADHYHFCDSSERVHEWFRSLDGNSFLPRGDDMKPFAELCSEHAGHDFCRALALAQFDAFLKDEAKAKDFLASDLVGLFSDRDVTVDVKP